MRCRENSAEEITEQGRLACSVFVVSVAIAGKKELIAIIIINHIIQCHLTLSILHIT